MNRVNAASRVGAFLTHPYMTLATRLILGGLFIFAGVSKATESQAFVDYVISYDILPETLAEVYALALPWVEIALGALLLLGLFLRLSAIGSGLVLVSFIIANSVAIYKYGGLHPCPMCFGTVTTLLSTQSLVLDFFMLALALQILFHRGEFLALGPWLSRITRRSTGSSA